MHITVREQGGTMLNGQKIIDRLRGLWPYGRFIRSLKKQENAFSRLFSCFGVLQPTAVKSSR